MKEKSNLKDAILSLLPPALAADLKDSIDATIQSQFEQMNLVSRKEFEVQQKVLNKTRAKLEAIKQTLKELEEQNT